MELKGVIAPRSLHYRANQPGNMLFILRKGKRIKLLGKEVNLR
jgi:hypothetical protein